ncbi:MAG: hypothetical protein IPL39_03055 [Opitutaceae bacterium]|nr:hypothetical protein [Opitutaceae bacterium]
MFTVARVCLLLIGVAMLVTPWRDPKSDAVLYSAGGLVICLLSVFARQKR